VRADRAQRSSSSGIVNGAAAVANSAVGVKIAPPANTTSTSNAPLPGLFSYDDFIQARENSKLEAAAHAASSWRLRDMAAAHVKWPARASVHGPDTSNASASCRHPLQERMAANGMRAPNEEAVQAVELAVQQQEREARKEAERRERIEREREAQEAHRRDVKAASKIVKSMPEPSKAPTTHAVHRPELLDDKQRAKEHEQSTKAVPRTSQRSELLDYKQQAIDRERAKLLRKKSAIKIQKFWLWVREEKRKQPSCTQQSARTPGHAQWIVQDNTQRVTSTHQHDLSSPQLSPISQEHEMHSGDACNAALLNAVAEYLSVVVQYLRMVVEYLVCLKCIDG